MSTRYITDTGFAAEVGTVIDGKYELIRHIGSGGSAKVWLARHAFGGFNCVLKFMNATRLAYELGLDEFRVLSQIYHPQIVRTFDMGEIADFQQAYISMEFVDGDTLSAYVNGQARASCDVVYGWLVQMVDVLRYIHDPRLNIIHKDIKPPNIVVGSQGAKLLDFNISTSGTAAHGTRAYKCPSVEQDGKWSRFADIWALAVTFYEVLAGTELFEGQTSFDVLLNADCPADFNMAVFSQLKAIIRGQVDRVTCVDDYRSLFGITEVSRRHSQIPAELATMFGISSRNQKFITLAMANSLEPWRPRSKDTIVRSALHNAGLPAAKSAVQQLRAVFSQLKSRGVVEYDSTHRNRAVLTASFMKEWKRTTGE